MAKNQRCRLPAGTGGDMFLAGQSTRVLLLRRALPTASLVSGKARSFKSYTAIYEKHGPPKEVLRVVPREVSEASLGPTDVLLGILAAPINPADINMLEGVGSAVKSLVVGDHVIPAEPGLGTWREHAILPETQVDRVSPALPLSMAATIAVNPCTAYRMLHDFQQLHAGDVVLQNGANSGVGLAVVQIARHLGLRTINVVRQRENFKELESKLVSLGSDLVITPDVLADDSAYKAAVSAAGIADASPRLGLNCVGGTAAANMAKRLAKRGTLVTYGGMSKRPVQVSTAKLIFADISLRGFWMSRWLKEHSVADRMQMIKTLTDMARSGALKEQVENFVFPEQMDMALDRALSPFRDGKVLLVMKTETNN
eukprot:g53256.t1